MGDLLQKYSAEGQQKAGANATRGPPVPEKDIHTVLSRYPLQKTAHILAMGSPAHMIKRGRFVYLPFTFQPPQETRTPH